MTDTTSPHLDAVLDRLDGARQYAGYHKALCPTHDDQEPSLSIRLNVNSKVALKCHAGCNDVAILDAVGLTVKDLYPPNSQKNGHAKRKQVKVYDYVDL